jgi:hypothetical protein
MKTMPDGVPDQFTTGLIFSLVMYLLYDLLVLS